MNITMTKMKMKYFVRMVVSVLVMACCAVPAQALDNGFYAQTSKLASGKWVKIAVTESGIHQITADDIRNWGLGSDLSQIHIFGYGGAPLSERMGGDNYADDLPQMPVVRTGDRILFYAQGPVTWAPFNKNFDFKQVQHPYATSGSYLVTNDSRFSDIDIEKAQNTPAGELVTSFTERLVHEQELINPGETGRVFLGEDFRNNKEQSFKFDLDGLVDGSAIKSYTVFATYTPDLGSTIIHTVNDSVLTTDDLDRVAAVGTEAHVHYKMNGKSVYEAGVPKFLPGALKTFTIKGTTDLNYTLKLSCAGRINLARLDYLTINYERRLALKDGELVFGLKDAETDKRYQLTGCGNATHVWNVSKPFALVEMNTVSQDGTVTFTPLTGGHQEFVAFDESGNFPKAKSLGEVANQNIHGEPTPDMIILAPSAYMEQARRVADMHEKTDGFRVLVLDHKKVFNEFSSGTQDAMAYRRLCKMFYDRGASEDGHKLGYLLLLGCGSYDNRLVGKDSTALNYPHLLTWQDLTGDNDEVSIMTDDYFGVLDDDMEVDVNDNMNIAVGRMVVKSVSEATAMVNKLIKYVTKPNYGAWKNQVLVVADDENKGDFMDHSISMVDIMNANGGSDMMYSHVFIDAFDYVSEGGSRSYPDARKKMFNTLSEGALWWNYIGHASTQNWTGEGLLMRSDVETQLFYRHLPVLYAATCEYARFDGATLSSGSRIYLNANGGAIAVLCPVRIAYSDKNHVFSDEVARYVFSPDEKGKPRRVGDILRLAKNGIYTTVDNNRRFVCIGDPAMRLAYATHTAVVDAINGKPVDPKKPAQFKAREAVEFSGRILDQNGELASNFNGSVVSTLLGPLQSVTTHGHGKEGKPVTYEDRTNRLAINMDTVVGGQFNVHVIIPSEVNNEYDNYRTSLINLYAYDSRDSLEAKGANSDFYIYGYEDELVTDTIGPKIITFGLNDDQFVDGSNINESPLVLATVSDESGVNFSSAGIGHNMTLTLDNVNSFNDVVSYYTPMFAEQGTLGSISYQLNDLSAGPHTLRLRVWDVYNNMNEKTLSFNVIHGLAPEIADIYTTSNPASVETSFYVKHDRPDAVVGVTIEVYDLMGRLVWKTTQSGRSDMYTSTPITWDLIDMAGRRVPRGIYIYRATISTDGVKEATKAKKLAVTQ